MPEASDPSRSSGAALHGPGMLIFLVVVASIGTIYAVVNDSPLRLVAWIVAWVVLVVTTAIDFWRRRVKQPDEAPPD